MVTPFLTGHRTCGYISRILALPTFTNVFSLGNAICGTCVYLLTLNFDSGLCHTFLIWAIEPAALSVLFTSSSALTDDTWRGF
jgi:hypothetical protein